MVPEQATSSKTPISQGTLLLRFGTQPRRSTVALLQNMIDDIADRNRANPPTQAIIVPVDETYRHPDGLLVAPYAQHADYDLTQEFARSSLVLREAEPLTERPIEPPCHLPTPTFRCLTTAQSAWYLWWRRQWLNGEAIGTSPGYILLLAYELLNFTWQPDKLRSYRLLHRLLNEEHSDPELQMHLLRWTADLAWELGLDSEALELFYRINSLVGIGAQMYVGRQSPPDINRIQLWFAHHQYNSKWRHRYQDDLCHLVYEAVADSRCCFTFPDACLESKLGVVKQYDAWAPYQNAQMVRTVYYRCFNLQNPNARSPLFTQFVRRLENLHREACGERRLLTTSPLPESIEQFIAQRAAFWPTLQRGSQPKPTAQVNIDAVQVETLLSSAVTLRQVTSDWLDQTAPTYAHLSSVSLSPRPFGDAVEGCERNDPVMRRQSADFQIGNVPLQASEPITTEMSLVEQIPSLGAIIAGLNDNARAFLFEFAQHQIWPLAEAREWARCSGTLLTSLIDAVNTTWVDLYDASLIVSSNAALQITSDFIEQFNSLLTLLKEDLA